MRNCWCQGPLSNVETEYNHYVKSQCSAESRMFVISAYKWSATRLLKDCAYKILPILNKIAMLFFSRCNKNYIFPNFVWLWLGGQVVRRRSRNGIQTTEDRGFDPRPGLFSHPTIIYFFFPFSLLLSVQGGSCNTSLKITCNIFRPLVSLNSKFRTQTTLKVHNILEQPNKRILFWYWGTMARMHPTSNDK